jgi:hypothetical protein
MADFRFDLAISLLDSDLKTAEQIRGALPTDCRVFLYSERQKELAGSDGIESFTAAFRRDSRLVLVLARKKWGETKWTRIEKTAITNRGYEGGYDFLLVVPLEADSIPDWVPAPRIWADLQRLGASGVAAVVEERLRQLGAVSTTESVEELNAKIERQQQQERDREGFLQSVAGVRAADTAFAELKEQLRAFAKTIGADYRQDSTGEGVLTKDGVSVTVSWYRRYSNTLNQSHLFVGLWDGIVSDNVASEFRAKKVVSELELHFDRRADENGWSGDHTPMFFTPANLAEHMTKTLLRAANDERVSL